MADLVKCEICGLSFGRITQSHLSKHSIDFDKYRSQYPFSKLVSSDILSICSIKKKEWHKNKIWTDDDRQKIGSGNRGKKFTIERRQKMANGHINRKPVSDITRKKISESKIGKSRPNEVKQKLSDFRKGKSFDDLYGIEMSTVIRKKISNTSKQNGLTVGNKGFTGKRHSPDTKYKMRLAAIRRLNTNHIGFRPNYNKLACKYFNRLMESTNTHIIHAENGGEFYIESLGYWVDGYDVKNNIVYEVYERRHFNKSRRERDMIRQNEIVNALNCKFIIINEDELNG